MRSLAPLIKRCKEERGREILKDLTGRLLKEAKGQQHDVGSLGLKTVVEDTPPGKYGDLLSQYAASDLLRFLSTDIGSPSTENECLDILSAMVSKYTDAMADYHGDLKEVIFDKLEGNKAGIRKRAMHCLAAMAPHMSESHFSDACSRLSAALSTRSSSNAARTHVQATAYLARSAGFRLGPYADSLLPALLSFSTIEGTFLLALRGIGKCRPHMVCRL